MRRETKNRALLGAAVLLAGVSLVSVQGIAQGMKEGGGPGGGGASPGMSGGERGGGAPSAAPSSSPKSSPGASEQRSGPGGGAQMDRGRAEQRGPAMQDRTTGQGSRDSVKPAPEPKASSAPEPKGKGQTTGKERDRTTGQGSRESAQPAPDSKSKSTSSPSQQPQKSQAPSDPKSDANKSDPNKLGTTGQGTTGAGTQTQPGSTTQSQPSGSTAQGQASGATLNTQQQASIQQSVLSANNAPRVSNVNFAISTGTVVPSHVRFVSISTFPILIETFPQYRDYSFFIVEEEIVIIEPRTRRIVQVVPVGSVRASRGGSASVEVLQLSEPEIREVQLVLVQRGLLVQADVTGVLNERTKTALISFQRQQGLQTSGSIDVRTVSALGLTSKVGPQKSGAASSPTTGSSTSQAPAGTQQPAQPSAQQGQTGQQQPQAQPGGQQSQQGTQGQAPSTTGSAPSTTGQGNPQGNQPAQANPPANAQPPAQNPQNQNQPSRNPQDNPSGTAPAR